MVKILLGISYLLFLVWLFRKTGSDIRSEESKTETESDNYSELSEKIDVLNSRKNSIDTMNNMIADVWECEPGKVHKTIIITIPENKHEYQFIINGDDDISQLLVEIFTYEREIQHTSLRDEISKIR